jgi:glycosyltransferase involved in cell wall biosynthesis
MEVVLVDARGEGDLAYESLAETLSIRTISLSRPLPRPLAANVGLDAAGGKYICFLDEDDYFDAEHVATLVGALENAGSVLLAYTGMRVFESDDRVPECTLHLEFSREFLFDRNFMSLGASMFARRLVGELGCRFDERFEILEDWDFFLQAAMHTTFARVEAVTSNYRAGLGQSGASNALTLDRGKLAKFNQLLRDKWAPVAAPFRARARGLLTEGIEAQRENRLAHAEQCFRKLLATNPHDLNALNLVGMLLHQFGRSDEALQHVGRAVSLAPQVAGLHYNLGLIQNAKGDFPGAKESFSTALALDGNFLKAREALERLEDSCRREM